MKITHLSHWLCQHMPCSTINTEPEACCSHCIPWTTSILQCHQCLLMTSFILICQTCHITGISHSASSCLYGILEDGGYLRVWSCAESGEWQRPLLKPVVFRTCLCVYGAYCMSAYSINLKLPEPDFIANLLIIQIVLPMLGF